MCNAQPIVWGLLMRTAGERAEENGHLVIRKVTEEERRRYPPLPSEAKRPAKR